MWKKILITIIAIAFIAGAIGGWLAWKYIYTNNVKINKPKTSFYIHTGDNFTKLMERIDNQDIVKNHSTFKWVAEKMNVPNHIYPGRYIISNDMNNRELATLIRSGKQTPVKITFNNVRTKKQLAGILASQIEADSAPIAEKLFNAEIARQFGFTTENFACMFLPNTYEVYWDIKPDELLKRFEREYKKFWTDEKRQKAEAISLTPVEVSILASIVEKESRFIKEYPVIAGVYLNRLSRGIPLQADPTIVFAIGNFSIKRVLNKHLEIKSPYNTYKNRGLPPGPIGIPSIQAINSVLNAQSHDYYYFCAKDDFSGKHVFAKTLRQHNQNARRYRKALNKKRIYR